MEISRIVPSLYHGTHPEGPDYRVLHDLGIGLVINMQGSAAPSSHPDPGPIPNLWLRTHDNPITRIPVDVLAEGALAARDLLDRDGKVFVHCRQGRHRSTAMVAAILITLGHSADQSVKLIKEGRPRANPRQWYIRERIDLFEVSWLKPRTERSDRLVRMGDRRLKEGLLRSAIRAYRLAIVANARNDAAWDGKAKVLDAVGKTAEATRLRAAAEWLRARDAAEKAADPRGAPAPATATVSEPRPPMADSTSEMVTDPLESAETSTVGPGSV